MRTMSCCSLSGFLRRPGLAFFSEPPRQHFGLLLDARLLCREMHPASAICRGPRLQTGLRRFNDHHAPEGNPAQVHSGEGALMELSVSQSSALVALPELHVVDCGSLTALPETPGALTGL